MFIPPLYNLGVETENSRILELKIPYKAFPIGNASWTKDGEKLENNSKYLISIDEK